MPSGSVVSFSWWFAVRLVSALVSSVVLSLLVWVKITVGWTMESISPYETLLIFSISPMFPARYGVVADLVGDFPVDSIYSESSSLAPKLATDVTSLPSSTGNMGDAA